jgi:hypothetical protein
MAIKVEELKDAKFVDEFENGFGWIGRPGEKMKRTSHAFVEDGEVYLVDPLDARNLDQKIDEYGEVKGLIVLFGRHVRDSEKLADKYDCPIYVPEWFERELDAEVVRVSGNIPDTELEIHDVVDSRFGNEAALYHENTKTLMVADSLGTARHLRGRGEELGMSPLYRLNPPERLLNFEPERIFCGHGEGVQQDASWIMERTIREGKRKTLSAWFNAVRYMI